MTDERFRLAPELKSKLRDFAPPSFYENYVVDLFELCKSLNIEVRNVEFKEDAVSGGIVKKGDQWTIYINHTDSPRRKRFTVAHELGHFFSYNNESYSKQHIDEQEGVLAERAIAKREAGSQNVVELEANEIAGEILMPESEVTKLVEANYNIEEIASAFDVSESAATVRLYNLGYRLLEYGGQE
jgi:Zn-dependent peptidase ImmA (M78 family)